MEFGEYSLSILQETVKWLPKLEERLYKMAPLATEMRPVRIQLEELKVRSFICVYHFIIIMAISQLPLNLYSWLIYHECHTNGATFTFTITSATLDQS